MSKTHRPVLTLLEALPRVPNNPLVFPALRGGDLSDKTLSATMKRLHQADVDAGGSGYVDRVSKRPPVPHGCARPSATGSPSARTSLATWPR